MGTILSVSPDARQRRIHSLDMTSEISYGSVSSSTNADDGGDRKKSTLKKTFQSFSSFNLKKLTSLRRGSKRVSSVKLPDLISTLDSATTGLEKSISCFTITDRQAQRPGARPAAVNEAKQHGAIQYRGKATISLLKKSDTFPHALQGDKTSRARPNCAVIQASTSELMRCIGEFVCSRCVRLVKLEPLAVCEWLRMVDRSLLYQGWQDIGFISPANLTFLYMLLRDAVEEEVESERQLQAVVLTCLYLSYSYMGNEISYPLKPFVIEDNRETFWRRCIQIVNAMSDQMLRINADPLFFTVILSELKSHSPSADRQTT